MSSRRRKDRKFPSQQPRQQAATLTSAAHSDSRLQQLYDVLTDKNLFMEMFDFHYTRQPYPHDLFWKFLPESVGDYINRTHIAWLHEGKGVANNAAYYLYPLTLYSIALQSVFIVLSSVSDEYKATTAVCGAISTIAFMTRILSVDSRSLTNPIAAFESLDDLTAAAALPAATFFAGVTAANGTLHAGGMHFYNHWDQYLQGARDAAHYAISNPVEAARAVAHSLFGWMYNPNALSGSTDAPAARPSVHRHGPS